MFDVLTVCGGRELYLRRLLTSMVQMNDPKVLEKVHHRIVFQGPAPSQELKNIIDNLAYDCSTSYSPDVKSIGAVMTHEVKNLSQPLFLKLDDDAVLRSMDFFTHLEEVFKLVGPASYSPYVVGLIRNPGGPPAVAHRCVYSKKLDTWYTLRSVNHVGGISRCIPTDIIKKVSFSDSHSEDGEVSSYCRTNGIPMLYTENALIVEHQEATLSQHERYPEYFKGRF